MESLSQRIQAAQKLLAPYAVPIVGVLGRATPEQPDATRFPFQRDRDRIIHTQAFRRLKGKTQVFIAPEGDHFRTRLTHTLEVTQLTRDIARTLRLNEDLGECIALAHDLGHPPFGHAGEEALNTWMQRFGKHFEHNRQSHRIVTVLEHRSSLLLGLNVNREVEDGLLKHCTPHDAPDGTDTCNSSLEAQVANLADEIAYTGHDTDDGLRAALFTLQDLQNIPLVRKAHDIATKEGTTMRSVLISLLVMDLYQETTDRLVSQCINTAEDALLCALPIVQFSASMRVDLSHLRDFLWNRMYLSNDVQKRSTEGKERIFELCDHFYSCPSDKILTLQKRTGSTLEEAVVDYISGMTDEFARQPLR